MPYYAIDWSRYANHVEVRTPPDAALLTEDLLKWPSRFCKLILFWVSYRLPNKHRWMANIHVGALITLCMVFAAIACTSLRFVHLSIDVRNARLISVFAYLLQCSASACCLVLWQVKKVFKNFVKRLEQCTLGVGMLKRKTLLTKTAYGVLVACGFWPLTWIVYFTTHAFFAQEAPMVPRPWNGTLLWYDSLNVVTYLVLIYMSLCWWLAHTYLITYYIFALVELHTLNGDLRSDDNLYQVPVLKHYAAIHYRLNRLYLHINGAFQPLIALTSGCNLVLLYCHVYCLFVDRYNMADAIFAGAVMFFVFIFTVAAVLISTAYERLITFIFDATLLVSVSDRNLYPEYYPVVNSYHDSFWMESKRKSILRQLAEIFVPVLAFFILLYYQTVKS